MSIFYILYFYICFKFNEKFEGNKPPKHYFGVGDVIKTLMLFYFSNLYSLVPAGQNL